MTKRTHVLLAGFVVLISALSLAPEARAAVSPLGVSILPPVQFPPGDFNVAGVRASVVWGKHRRVYGLDIAGIGNMTEQQFAGIAAAGGFNLNHGLVTVVFLQAAGVGNFNQAQSKIFGVQVAGLINSNKGESTLIGLQLAPINLSAHTKIGGIQAGIFNTANEVYGIQIGLVNVTQRLHGLQIGLVNFHREGLFAVAPLLNFGF